MIEQFNLLQESTSFLGIQEESVVIPVRREGIPTFTYPFKTKENPLRKPFYTNTTFEINPFSLFGNMRDEEEGLRVENQDRLEDHEQTFGFPILDLAQDTNMKTINPSVLPTFHGMSMEDPDAFLFEFDILCKSYNYINDAKKLKLFPTTLKDAALRWFMGLGEYSIRSWEQMKNFFLKKYQDYYQSRDAKNDIFKMQQMEEETLEDYLERFLYSYQKSKQRLKDNTMKIIFLKGIEDEYINILNLMGSRDISLLPFDDIEILCQKYSRSKAKHGKSIRYTRVNKST